MRTFALTHDGIITRVQQADQNPFHGSLHSIEVTGIPAQPGNTVDAVGNVGPSVAMSAAAAATTKASMLRGESRYRATLGICVPDGDARPVFDTGHGNLALLAALADGKSALTPAADGTLACVPAAKVYAAAAKYRAAVLAREAELRQALADDPTTDIMADWPDNGTAPQEPPAPEQPAPLPAVPNIPLGTGIVPEQTVDAPHADLRVDVTGIVTAPVVQP